MGQTVCCNASSVIQTPAKDQQPLSNRNSHQTNNGTSPMAFQQDQFAMFQADIPLQKVYLQDYIRLLQKAQVLTSQEGIQDDLLQINQTLKVDSKNIDYVSPIKAKFMRQVFGPALGSIWTEIGKADSELNLMLSSPIFRHLNDYEGEKMQEQMKLGLTTPRSQATADTIQLEDQAVDPLKQAIRDHQVTDETLLDMTKLMLLALLYCKGSRIGKSNLFFPMVTRQLFHQQATANFGGSNTDNTTSSLSAFSSSMRSLPVGTTTTLIGQSEEQKDEASQEPNFLKQIAVGETDQQSSRRGTILTTQEREQEDTGVASVAKKRRRTLQITKGQGIGSEELPPSDANGITLTSLDKLPTMDQKQRSLPSTELRGNVKPTERLTFGHDDTGSTVIHPQKDIENTLLTTGTSRERKQSSKRQGSRKTERRSVKELSQPRFSVGSQSHRENHRNTVSGATASQDQVLRKNCALLKQCYITLVQLSTRLIDVNWDKQILESCMLATKPLQSTPDQSQDEIDQLEHQRKIEEVQKQDDIIQAVYDRMFKKFTTELFKGCQKENGGGMLGVKQDNRSDRKKKKKSNITLTKTQFLYQMDDGTQVSKYLLEPAFLRELYLFELATTIALMREDMLAETSILKDTPTAEHSPTATNGNHATRSSARKHRSRQSYK